jgi:uncharacterized membrane protein YsdA (DUF1294 family)
MEAILIVLFLAAIGFCVYKFDKKPSNKKNTTTHVTSEKTKKIK